MTRMSHHEVPYVVRRSAGRDRRKLTPKQRDEIRARFADGESAKDLALEFGVSAYTIYRHTDPRPKW